MTRFPQAAVMGGVLALSLISSPGAGHAYNGCAVASQFRMMDHCISFRRSGGLKILTNNCGTTIRFHYCELTSPSNDPDSCAYSGQRATKFLSVANGKTLSFPASEKMRAWPHVCR